MKYWVCTRHSRIENADNRLECYGGGARALAIYCTLGPPNLWYRQWYVVWDDAHTPSILPPQRGHIGHAISFVREV